MGVVTGEAGSGGNRRVSRFLAKFIFVVAVEAYI